MPEWRNGRRAGFKIRFPRECGFKSHLRYHLMTKVKKPAPSRTGASKKPRASERHRSNDRALHNHESGSHDSCNHDSGNHNSGNHDSGPDLLAPPASRTSGEGRREAGAEQPGTSPAAQVLEQLSNAGFRLTKLRKVLVELIASSRGPLSVSDLRSALLVSKLAPNKSTLYRELYFLMEQKLVAEVDFLDGMKRYEFIAHDGHHHHIICTKCKAVECVEVCFDTSALLADLAKHSDFLVQNHVLEFFGLCGNCK